MLKDTLCYVDLMATITIPRTEYRGLKRQSAAYKKLATRLFDAVVKDDVATVVEDFRKTGLYTDGFLEDLASGLSKSSYNRPARNGPGVGGKA